MPLAASRFRRWLWLGFTVAALLAAGLFLARLWLAEFGAAAVLRLAGAGEIRLTTVAASPRRVVLEAVGFRLRTQRFEARRITVERPHWWTLGLGRVRVQEARIPIVIDGSDVNPWQWTAYSGRAASRQGSSPWTLPLEELELAGQLVVQAAVLPDRILQVQATARRSPEARWSGRMTTEGPGMAVKLDGDYDLTASRGQVHVTRAAFDLKLWQDHIQRTVLLPGGSWRLQGRLEGTAAITVQGKKVTADGQITLRDGALEHEGRGVRFDGVWADLFFTDFDHFRSRPGQVRVRELRSGDLVVNDLALELAFAGFDRVVVSRATLSVFGGRVAAEPFKVFLNQQELEATVTADGLEMEQILAAVHDVPAQARGRIDGCLPIRIDSAGLRFGTGWLELKKGTQAEIQFDAAGLLTGGLATTGPTYALMQRIENGLMRLRLSELRLDLRPPDGPPGRSAVLHMRGDPVDPAIKAPVLLDLNVNGPIEQLLNLGLSQRTSIAPR